MLAPKLKSGPVPSIVRSLRCGFAVTGSSAARSACTISSVMQLPFGWYNLNAARV
jgi:hypothetical protein